MRSTSGFVPVYGPEQSHEFKGVSTGLYAGFTAADGLSVTRVGNLVTIEGTLRRTAGNFPASYTPVLEIPLGFRPRGYRRITSALYATGNAGGLLATVRDELVQVSAVGNSADTFYFCHTYLAARAG